MVPQDATRAPLGHPWPSLSCHGQRRHVEDGRNPPPSAKLAHLVGRRHRAALRCLGLPGHARAEAAGGGGGEGRRVLPGLECLAQVSPHRSSPAHLAQHRRKGRCATCWPLGRRLARSRPPPPPGGGLRRHRRHRGRRHLPRRHLFSSVDRCGGRPGLHMAGAACGGEAGALADEAEQARAYVAWLCRHALNPHTERPCTLPVTARTPCAHPCPHRAHRRAWVRAAWSARG